MAYDEVPSRSRVIAFDGGISEGNGAIIIQRNGAVAMSDLEAGAAVTITERRIALRRLPLSAK